jgi:RNA polymerase sigma-70 factor (ECF subfamily)
MDEHHLSQIHTMWSIVRRAHGGDSTGVQSAQEEMLQRYGDAARRYLLAALRDADAADEVYQEFVVKFVRGDFRDVAPERGRFRNFVKSVLFRMIVDYFRQKKRQPQPQQLRPGLEPEAERDEDQQDEEFARTWRDELLVKAWAALEQYEAETGKPLYTALRLRVDRQQLRSPELADELSAKLGRPVTAANMRVILHRARDQFAEFLVQGVVHSLESSSPGELEEELAELRLLDYCRPVLERRRMKEA